MFRLISFRSIRPLQHAISCYRHLLHTEFLFSEASQATTQELLIDPGIIYAALSSAFDID